MGYTSGVVPADNGQGRALTRGSTVSPSRRSTQEKHEKNPKRQRAFELDPPKESQG